MSQSFMRMPLENFSLTYRVKQVQNKEKYYKQ